MPTCPGWSVRNLVDHLGNVHAWAAGIVRTGAAGGGAPPIEGDLVAWYAAQAADLDAALLAADPLEPAWNFAKVNETKGFWIRRQALETLMHLVDLDLAAGRGTEMLAVEAADGIAETFEVFLPRMLAKGSPTDLAAPLSVIATDAGEAWTLTPYVGAPPAVSAGATSDHRLEANAADLWLRLWNRGALAAGDDDVVRRFLASTLVP